jgi:hypothetical protein
LESSSTFQQSYLTAQAVLLSFIAALDTPTGSPLAMLKVQACAPNTKP